MAIPLSSRGNLLALLYYPIRAHGDLPSTLSTSVELGLLLDLVLVI